jgi:RES domain-containing protein
MPALYMSEQVTTAIAEYEQDLGIRPGMLCAYVVDISGIVDLCDAVVLEAADVNPADLRCSWKRIAFVDKRSPPTWDIARRLFDAGAAGIRVPSMQSVGGANLGFWRRIEALDPLGDLPRDQNSWLS